MINNDQINEMKKFLNRDKSSDEIPIYNPGGQFNKFTRKNNTSFETFCPNYNYPDYNAVIGWDGESYYYGYKEGFFQAAHMSIKLAKYYSDSLVYPIIFNYRHYLELVLKENILRFQIFFRLPITYTKTHNLIRLLDELESILVPNNLSFLISPAQKKVIQDFHKIDSQNDAFRFVFNTQGSLSHAYDHKQISLWNLHFTMNEIYNDFTNIDYLFVPNGIFHDDYLTPQHQSFIVAISEFFKVRENRNFNSFNKLKSILLNFEHQLSQSVKYKFAESGIVQISPARYEATLYELSLTIIISVNNVQDIDHIKIK
ncbi:hypothetical protein [Bacillus tequilensis]|uniref:Uncharacterized protein n=1 Tax=Bacillus tequilensis TaxID=227866 RepID=A0A6H0WHC2_9BACI|nr:hypothetical protein [Bacillus tequilensis]QIW79950.1 hypothetical protein G4P54_09085 [Bacillus tequilensis]